MRTRTLFGTYVDGPITQVLPWRIIGPWYAALLVGCVLVMGGIFSYSHWPTPAWVAIWVGMAILGADLLVGLPLCYRSARRLYYDKQRGCGKIR